MSGGVPSHDNGEAATERDAEQDPAHAAPVAKCLTHSGSRYHRRKRHDESVNGKWRQSQTWLAKHSIGWMARYPILSTETDTVVLFTGQSAG
jgi:hypothetical protein